MRIAIDYVVNISASGKSVYERREDINDETDLLTMQESVNKKENGQRS